MYSEYLASWSYLNADPFDDNTDGFQDLSLGWQRFGFRDELKPAGTTIRSLFPLNGGTYMLLII